MAPCRTTQMDAYKSNIASDTEKGPIHPWCPNQQCFEAAWPCRCMASFRMNQDSKEWMPRLNKRSFHERKYCSELVNWPSEIQKALKLFLHSICMWSALLQHDKTSTRLQLKADRPRILPHQNCHIWPILYILSRAREVGSLTIHFTCSPQVGDFTLKHCLSRITWHTTMYYICICRERFIYKYMYCYT